MFMNPPIAADLNANERDNERIRNRFKQGANAPVNHQALIQSPARSARNPAPGAAAGSTGSKAGAAASGNAGGNGATNNADQWKDQRYLLIDSALAMRQLLREALRGLGARYVDQAGSGSEAVAMLQQQRYDVVLCDFDLGRGKNGQQVLEEAQFRELILPTTVWIMVSAEKNIEAVMAVAEYRPDAYLIKPITEEVLLTRLNRAWKRKQVFRALDAAYREKNYYKAAQLCDAQIEQHKNQALPLLRMKASLLLKCGQTELARAVFERALATRNFNWAMAGIAKIRNQNGEPEIAKQILLDVINENRYYLDAYDELANAHQQLGQFEEAAKILERAAKLSPNSLQRQKNLGEVALKLGNTDQAERAFRKCLAIGEFSVLKSPDPYLGLARVCGLKKEPEEALQLLAQVQKEFNSEQVRLRSKITEGLVHHENGDDVRARRSGTEIGQILSHNPGLPAPGVCLDMARLLFAVGANEAPVQLLTDLAKNNHDNEVLLDEIQQVFEAAKMGDEGLSIIVDSRKQASDLMNRGVLLWKTGKLEDAVKWMRHARRLLPNNHRVLLNCAQIYISAMEKLGYDPLLADETREILQQIERLTPGQQRFVALMNSLQAMTPATL
jgi:tetratricopeptide (TPR) repeat protein